MYSREAPHTSLDYDKLNILACFDTPQFVTRVISSATEDLCTCRIVFQTFDNVERSVGRSALLIQSTEREFQ